MKWILAICLMWPALVLAQDDPAEAARAAAERLAQAAQSLDAADGARNRVKALTETVHA